MIVSLQHHSELNRHTADDACLRLGPSIFQPEIKKAFELRVLFIGSTIFAVKIDSQRDKKSIDWRKDYLSLPPCSIFELPRSLVDSTHAYIKESGLRYGSIDMIVDLDGQYHFLEVNETGQFLWIEELLPDLPLLDCFCSYLIARNDGFVYRSSQTRVSCKEFKHEVTPEALRRRRTNHVDASAFGVLAE